MGPEPLAFQESVAQEVLSSGGALWLLAPGLGLRSLFARLLDLYQPHQQLIIVLGITPEELGPLETLRFTHITGEVTAQQRFSRPSPSLPRPFPFPLLLSSPLSYCLFDERIAPIGDIAFLGLL